MNDSLRNMTVVRVEAVGAGLFPLGALVRCDGFFADVGASRAARDTRPVVRRVAVLVPDPEAFARELRREGWSAEWSEVHDIPTNGCLKCRSLAQNRGSRVGNRKEN